MKSCLIILTLALTLANSPTMAQDADADRPADEPMAYLGVAPDQGADVVGLRIDGISPESPAAEAGLKKGDVIVQFGTVPVS